MGKQIAGDQIRTGIEKGTRIGEEKEIGKKTEIEEETEIGKKAEREKKTEIGIEIEIEKREKEMKIRIGRG